MKVLVIGSGGREHALVWKLAQSSRVTKIYCAPGNDAIAKLAKLVPIGVEDLGELVSWAQAERIDLTVVGPEMPLTLGLVDRFQQAGLKIFGPTKAAAQLEGSKAFAKKLMEKYDIPTAKYRTFTDPHEAKEYIKKQGVPLVIKADGLAAGKGVFIVDDLAAAFQAVELIMEEAKFGVAGQRIIVEEFLTGTEVSLLALTDGQTVLPMAPAHDHKAVYDGDQGPNTGGMGAFSPSNIVNDQLVDEISQRILIPTVQALKAEGITYQGVLYAGLILTDHGPRVLEFNARFGDPETQVILTRLENDLCELLLAVIDGSLNEKKLNWSKKKSLTVILAAAGYPLAYQKGEEIKGLDSQGQLNADVIVFHAGTRSLAGKWLTNGGRVLAVTALGADFQAAQKLAYNALQRVSFKGCHYRRDIGDQILPKKAKSD